MVHKHDSITLPRYVSLGGAKLEFALEFFGIDVTDKLTADLGCNIGGFVDCLLQHGARKVFAIDTGYGVLAWRLRNHPHVTAMERQNALHITLSEQVDLVTIDVAWTPQRLILPKALTLCRPQGLILSLLKPQYEAQPDQRRKGIVYPDLCLQVVTEVIDDLRLRGIHVQSYVECPVRRSKSNVEYWLLIQ